MSDSSATIVYGDFSFAVSSLPEASLVALLRRGVAHRLGNEVASKVSTYKAKPISEEVDGVKSERLPTEEETEAFKAAALAQAVTEIREGTIGTAVRGPSKDPLEAAIDAITRQSVIATLKANNIKPPKGDEVITLAGGVTRTMAEMMEKRYAKDKASIDKEAARRVADAKKRADEAKARVDAAKAKGDVTVDDLGL